MKKSTAFLSLVILISPLWSQSRDTQTKNEADENAPVIEILIRDSLEYERPARLKEEDYNSGRQFKFSPGLEIITDVEYVKVFIRDSEVGRTPFESSRVASGYLRVRLEKPGYEDCFFWVNVYPDKRTTVMVTYKSQSARPSYKTEPNAPRVSRELYKDINPDDPFYYRNLYFLTEDDLGEIESILVSRADQSLVALNPSPYPAGVIFEWDGEDASGNEMPDGEYSLQFRPVSQMDFRIDRNYSRRPLSYFSGFSGLTLVPTATTLFAGGFQFGSIFAVDRIHEEDSHSYNLPFSFFFRLSPLSRWEASAEVATSFINEYKRPSLRINMSHKVSLLKDSPFRVALGLRGSYKSAISDFEKIQGGALIRDPAGLSLFVPLQFRYSLWEFYASPEFLYSLHPLGSDHEKGEFEMSPVLRWGVSYGTGLFSAALSTSLFLPSNQRGESILQGALEGSYYFPDSPMYMGLFGIIQSNFENRARASSFGLNLGFLI